MKKIILFALCSVFIVSCSNFGSKKDSLQAENDSLAYELANKNAELDEIMSTFNEIQTGFQEINQAENRVDLNSRDLEGKNSADKLKEDILYINKKLKENRNRILELEAKLAKSSYQSEQFKKTIKTLTAELALKEEQIKTLRAELEARNIRIMELDNTVSDLNKNVSELSAENEAKAKAIALQEKALNTAWYVFGTKSELKDQKILKSGSVLKDNSYNKDYFTQIDIRTQKEIKLYSKRAELLTNHPKGSYELVKDSKGQLTLKITKPNEFWSVSRYLVIQIRG